MANMDCGDPSTVASGSLVTACKSTLSMLAAWHNVPTSVRSAVQADIMHRKKQLKRSKGQN